MHQKLSELVEELKHQRKFPPTALGLTYNYMKGIGQLRQQIKTILDDLISIVIKDPKKYDLCSEQNVISSVNEVQQQLFTVGRGCITQNLPDIRDRERQTALMRMLDEDFNHLFDHLVRTIKEADIDSRFFKTLNDASPTATLIEHQKPKPPCTILLLHGIRTDAHWHQEFREDLSRGDNVSVESRKYGNVSIVAYALPAQRKKNLDWLREKIETIKERCQDGDVHVVAHSFGAYLIGEVLKRNPGLRINRVILCGSVLKRDLDWHRLLHNKQVSAIVNECGTHDIWPVLSRIFVPGTGDSGVFGFDSTGDGVHDRFFEYYTHSSFFTKTHIQTYWRPFLIEGRVVPGPQPVPKPASIHRILASHRWAIRLMPFLLLGLFAISIAQFSNQTLNPNIALGLRYPYEFKGGYGGARNDSQGQFRLITNEPIRLDFASGKQETFRFGVQNTNPWLPVENTRIHIIFSDAGLKITGDPPWQTQIVNHDMSFNLGTINSGEFINAHNLYVTFPRPGAYNLIGVIVGKGISPIETHFQVILE